MFHRPEPEFDMTAHVTQYAKNTAKRSVPQTYLDAYFALEKQAQEIPVQTVTAPAPLAYAPSTLDVVGEPDCLFEGEGAIPFRGQDRVKKRLRVRIKALRQGTRAKGLFTGAAGAGKTALARIVAKEIRDQWADLGVTAGFAYFELLPAQVEKKEQLDLFMRSVVQFPYAVVFTDEVHTLKNLENFFHTLHDTGELKYPLSDGQWLMIPRTISWFFATTDPGELDTTVGGAMRRRMEPEFRLEAPDKEVLAEIALDAGIKDGMEVHPDAAYEIAERSIYPWQVKHLYEEARSVALAEDSDSIDPHHATEAFELAGVDANGLLDEDREVIRVLLSQNPTYVKARDETVYQMSEGMLCPAAGVDLVTYRKRIQPKLVRLRLLQVRTKQELTEHGLALYGWLAERAGD